MVYRYTTKERLVGVVSNGTAVLGLGNIGALASKVCLIAVDSYQIACDGGKSSLIQMLWRVRSL